METIAREGSIEGKRSIGLFNRDQCCVLARMPHDYFIEMISIKNVTRNVDEEDSEAEFICSG